jgi:prophage DNA circulation protein
MFDWLRNFWGGLTNIPEAIARIALAINRIITTFTDHFYSWYNTFRGWAAGFGYYIQSIQSFAVEVLTGMAYIVYALLPNWARNLIHDISAWTIGQLSTLSNTLHGLVTAVVTWAAGELASLRNTVTGWVNNIIGSLGNLWNRFLLIERRVIGLLTHPEDMASWLAGAIVKAVWRWALPQAISWGGFLFRHAVPITSAVAGMLERIIVDVFG